MQVEMIGCTSAGKSTLAASAIEAGDKLSLQVVMSDEMILRRMRLHSLLRGRFARTIAVDLVALATCGLTAWRHRHYYRLALGICRRSSGSTLGRLNLARNAVRKIGIFEFIRRYAADSELVLVDEGTLHAAHNLFVDVSGEDRSDVLAQFLQLAPLPDVVVHLRQDEAVLVQRTIERGHKRVPDGTRASVERFIQRAVGIFDLVCRDQRVTERLLIVDAPAYRVTVPEAAANPRVAQAQRIFVECAASMPPATRPNPISAPVATVGASCPS